MDLRYKKIVLVNPFPYYAYGINEATVYPPLGLASIAAYLEKFGAVCKIIDANILEMRNDEVIQEIKEFGPDMAGVQMNIITAKAGIELCKQIKSNLGIPIAIGGPFMPDALSQLLIDTKADCFVQGEGETTFLEICMGHKFDCTNGIYYLKDGKAVFTSPRGLIKNLDDLPSPAYHLLPDLRLYRSRSRKRPVAPIFTSRGCPYKCTFCSSSSEKSPFGNKIRFRSAEKVVEEIEHLIKNFGIKQIDILDDNFTFDMERAEKILDLIIEKKLKIFINIQNGVRADKINRTLVQKMKKAGVYKTGIGIESGDTGVLLSIKKGLDLKKVEEALKLFRESGIITVGFFMLGFPSDTEESIQRTIDFAIKTNPSIANFSLVLPLPGTELYDQIKSKGYLRKSMDQGGDTGFYSDDFYYEPPNISKEKILALQKKAYSSFFFRPSKIIETIKDMKSVEEWKWTLMAAKPLLKRIFSFNKKI